MSLHTATTVWLWFGTYCGYVYSKDTYLLQVCDKTWIIWKSDVLHVHPIHTLTLYTSCTGTKHWQTELSNMHITSGDTGREKTQPPHSFQWYQCVATVGVLTKRALAERIAWQKLEPGSAVVAKESKANFIFFILGEIRCDSVCTYSINIYTCKTYTCRHNIKANN